MGTVSPDQSQRHKQHLINPTFYRSAVHYLVLGECLAFVILVGRCPRRLASDDRQFHMLDLYAYKQEEYLPHYHIFQVVPSRDC